jgi:hypothetical protein
LIRERPLFEWRVKIMSDPTSADVVMNAGWKFSYLQNVEDFLAKLRQFSHSESSYLADSEINIEDFVKSGSDLLERERDGY